MQRYTILTTLLVFLFGSWMLSDGSAQETRSSQATTLARTLILVRHGEKLTEDPRDPELSEAGEARAAELARVLGESKVSHLFSTAYKRTRATLAPLASAQGLEIAEYDPRDMPAFMASIKQLPPGSVAVIAGHSNTTPGLYKSLSGKDAAEVEQHPRHGALLPDTAYDRLFVVALVEREGELDCVSSVELRYGAQ